MGLRYSIVVPIYNDGYLAEKFCIEFEGAFHKYLKKKSIEKDIELIFVNDGSPNNSWDELRKLLPKFKFVKLINLSRNFGQHIALSCGYKHASGEYVGMLNVDMQEHPDQIPILLDVIIQGKFDIVYGLRDSRKGTFFEKLTSRIFTLFFNKLTNDNTPVNASTLRIMSRRFVDVYNSLSEKSRFLPGLEAWIGFERGYIPIKHQDRTEGKSSYNFKKRMAMAINAVISFSDYPLKLTIYTGFIISTVGFIFLAVLIFLRLYLVNFQAGFVTIVSLIIFIGGIQILLIGLIGLYIGKILREVQNRPVYVVREYENFGGRK